MESFFARYRNLVVLLAILLAQIIGLAMQVRRTGDGRSTLDPATAPGFASSAIGPRPWFRLPSGSSTPPSWALSTCGRTISTCAMSASRTGFAEDHRPPAPGAGRAA
jgi:hypothetical protein